MTVQDAPNEQHSNVTGAAWTADRVARTVVAAREQMTRRAAVHPAFRGLGHDDVEELFDATAEIVLERHAGYRSDDHVRASLWRGMELRARDLFRRRHRRRFESDQDVVDAVTDPAAAPDEQVTHEQTMLVVRDFLAALTPREAEVWKLVHGEDMSVAATSRTLAISRHAVGEHLDAATRKLETFTALMDSGEWCGRRQADISRVLDGATDESTRRRAMAHLDACAVCRRANAARVREVGGLAAGVLPLPGLLGASSGRTLLERIADLVAHAGGGSGRTEALGGALFGGGGLAIAGKVGAVVATTALVSAGGGALLRSDASPVRPAAATNAARPAASGAARAPAPASVRVATPQPARPRQVAQAAPRARPRRVPRRERAVASLGTVEPTATASATPATTTGPSLAPAPPAPPQPGGRETFLP